MIKPKCITEDLVQLIFLLRKKI